MHSDHVRVVEVQGAAETGLVWVGGIVFVRGAALAGAAGQFGEEALAVLFGVAAAEGAVGAHVGSAAGDAGPRAATAGGVARAGAAADDGAGDGRIRLLVSVGDDAGHRGAALEIVGDARGGVGPVLQARAGAT